VQIKLKNAVRISSFLALQILCYFFQEFTFNEKNSVLFGANTVVWLYMIFNLVYAAGIIAYGLLQRWIYILFDNRLILNVLALINTFVAIAAFLPTDKVVYTISAVLLTFITGIFGGHAYYTVAKKIPKYWRGRVVAGGLCTGTIIHFVVAAALFPGYEYMAQVFKTGILCAAIISSYLLINTDLVAVQQPDVCSSPVPKPLNDGYTFAVLIASVVILCYLHSLNDGIVTMYHAQGNINLYTTRLFYAASLIVAGLIADLRGRQYLPVLSLAVMTSVALNIILLDYPAAYTISLILMYIGSGFFVMFFTVAFLDVALFTNKPALWAGVGRIIKHTITGIGAVIGSNLWTNPANGLLSILVQYVTLLIILIFLSFKLYEMLKDNPGSVLDQGDTIVLTEHPWEVLEPELESPQNNIELEIGKYGFTDRERQLLAFILAGSAIKEMAHELCITERTVKFHISNILTKTGSKNQKELLSLLYGFHCHEHNQNPP